jgi:hypothetical protein
MLKMTPVDDETASALTAKCQENGWLRIGGFDWQDDPFMEEYPYEFASLGSIEELREFALNGNWAIRQGVVYGDLAFIQQVNGGDEFWTLKRNGDSWVGFESVSLGHMAKDGADFERVIAAMRNATSDECRRLTYMDHAPTIAQAAQAAREASRQFDKGGPDPQAIRREQGRS